MRRPHVHTERRVVILPGVTMPVWWLRFGLRSRTAGRLRAHICGRWLA